MYLAHDPVIGRHVAVKVIRTLDEPGLLERFHREIRIAGALSHPSIVRIYDAGVVDEQPFVAMEYIAGKTLDALIKEAAPLDLDRKLALLTDLALGLSHAHAFKVVHRDIKPSNLIVDQHDRLKILDFGVARFAGSGNTSHVAVGTPGYMSPEQLQGHAADIRSDIFAAGVVAYEFIAYRRPFTGDQVAVVYQRILHDTPRPLGEVAPGVPVSLERLIARCLEKDPDRRPQDAVEFASALRKVRESLTDEETTLTAVPVPVEGRDAFGSAGSTPRRTPSSTAQRVAELRRRVLAEAKAHARDALQRGDYVRAIDAAEHALVIDASDDEAAALLEQARTHFDHQEPELDPLERTLPGRPEAPRSDAVEDGAVWGRSFQTDKGRSLQAVGWAISASVHTALAIVVAMVMFGSYALARPPETLRHLAIPVVIAPLPPNVPVAHVSRRVESRPRTTASPIIPANPDVSPPAEAPARPELAPLVAPSAINPELNLVTVPMNGPSEPVASSGPAGTIDEQPVTDADRQPVMVTMVKPKVPVGASGVVRVEVTIGSDGAVRRVRLLDPTPYGEAIIEAAEQCKFRPARRRGRAVVVNQIIVFDMATDR